MKSAPTSIPEAFRRSRRGYTLAEVLAALLFMAIVIPVAMQGMSVASRAGMLGQRKAVAIRIAERVLNEMVVTGDLQQTSSSGTITEGDTSYPWTMESDNWSADSLTELTVHVQFLVQGNTYEVTASTLVDPTASTGTSSTSTTF
jgi:type II secretory pathway component PulJ